MGDARISGEMDMRNMIKIVTILALLGGRGATAQTVGPTSVVSSSIATGPLSLVQHTRSIEAPVGHRQPRARDVPLKSPTEIERLAPEDAAIDRKLVICRGC
jgi:hypothetical protein